MRNPMESSAQDIEQVTDDWAAGMREDQRALLDRAARGDPDASAQAQGIGDQIDVGLAGATDRATYARMSGEESAE